MNCRKRKQNTCSAMQGVVYYNQSKGLNEKVYSTWQELILHFLYNVKAVDCLPVQKVRLL